MLVERRGARGGGCRLQQPARPLGGLLELRFIYRCVPIAMSQTATVPANAQTRYEVRRADLPLCCPTPEMALWNSHPRVYLPIQDAADRQAKCPYCGSVFVLVD